MKELFGFTDIRTHIRTHTFLTVQPVTNIEENPSFLYKFMDFACYPVCIGTKETDLIHEKPLRLTSPETRPLLSGSYLNRHEGVPGVHNKRRPLDLTEITLNN